MNQLSLDGIWQLRSADGQRGKTQFSDRDQTDAWRTLDAQVPGSVHLDLMRAGLIGDPSNELNVLAARWVEERIWSYRREFETPATIRSTDRAWLCFEQLDYAAKIVLNGEEIGRHANFFRPCRIEVTGKLRRGVNVLNVHLDAGLYAVADKPIGGWARGDDTILTKRTWLRKPQFQFGWDWSTRLINVGISGGVRLEWSDAPLRVEAIVPLAELSADLHRGKCKIRVILEDVRSGTQNVTATAMLRGGKTNEKTVAVEGPQALELSIDVDRPELWWPIGQGEPHLYALDVTVRVGELVLSQRRFDIGFRHVRFNQDVHPVSGRYFKLEINGRPIFCKGANLVPADMILARLDEQRYDTLVDRAIEANFNFLRVWGGGLYEHDHFYDICNKRGILVWQEFIFACDKFPAIDEAFHAEVVLEARYQIRRLAAHPSLIAWCGNNEIDEANWHWADMRKGVINPDHALYHVTLPRLLCEEDPARYYQPSSPFSPEYGDPKLDDRGDQHPWTVGFANTDFRDYRKMICRFPNEGGILGATSLPTTLACLPEGQRHHGSFAWQLHDNGIDTWFEPSAPDQMIKQWTGLDPHGMSVEQFVYWAGVVQGEGLSEYVHNFRRRMFDSAAAIFWMFNDCWPATRSFTIVDYALRRTPSFHPVRRAMAPVNVVVIEDGEVVRFIGVNDTQSAVSATLSCGIIRLDGGDVVRNSTDVLLTANSATSLATISKSLWTDPTTQIAVATLRTSDGELIAQNRLFLPFFAEMQWAKADVAVSVSSGKATFKSPTFAWRVAIDLDGETQLPDNFFDLLPNESYTIPWPHAAPPKVLYVGNLAV